MSYSKLYFGKELNELTIEDIEHFFSEAKDESNKIEYKSYRKPQKSDEDPIKGVIKAIAALLNSEGGLVIWGAPDGKEVPGKKEKVFEGALCPVEMRYEKDSFITKLADSITPSPTGILFQSFQKDGKYVYIIDVAQSSYSPHQYKDIYYMRIDGQTRPAPHHYIEALFRKITFPKLEGYIKVTRVEKTTRYDSYQGIAVYFSVIIHNMSKLQNEYDLYYRVHTDGNVYNTNSANGRIYRNHEIVFRKAAEILFFMDPIDKSDRITFSENQLREDNFKGIIDLYFGGKQSPLMISSYTFSFAKIYTENPHINPETYITDSFLNTYIHELDFEN